MRFLSLIVRGFGSLRPGAYPFTERTLVIEQNAAGKTTLTAALRAALYGLPDDRRRRGQRELTDHEAHQPWRGDAYGLTLRLEARGDVYLIERDFARGGGSGVFKVWDGQGADVTERFLCGRGGDTVGSQLAGVGPFEFERTTLASDAAWGRFEQADPGGLVDLLAAAVTTDTGGGTSAAALAACDDALRRYEATTLKGAGLVETEIRNLEARSRDARQRLDELESEHALNLEALTRLATLRAELSRADRELAGNRRRRLLAQCASTRRDLETRASLEAEITRAASRAAELSPLDGFPTGRGRELAALAEQAISTREQARFQRQRIDDKIAPRLADRQRELDEIGSPGEGSETAELSDLLSAALSRASAVDEFAAQLRALRQRIEEDGESVELMARLHAGLPRLAESDRQFLRELERVEFELTERASRCAADEGEIRQQVRDWNRRIGMAVRWRLAGIVVGAAGAVATLLSSGGLTAAAVLGVPTRVQIAGGVGLLVAGALVTLVAQRRASGLRRRCALQGEQRLQKLDEERAGLAQRQLVRRERLAAMAPVVMGREAAERETADPDDFLALYRRYDSFRIRHAEWFRLEDRLADERSELIRLKTKLPRFLPPPGRHEAEDPAAASLSLFQAERARRLRSGALTVDVDKLRELLADAEHEEQRLVAEADKVCRAAVGILASLPVGARYPLEQTLARSAAADGDAPPDVTAARADTSAERERLANAFRQDPRAVAQWFAARAEEAAELCRLRGDVIPGLTRQLDALPAVEQARAALAGLELELVQVERAAVAAIEPEDGPRAADSRFARDAEADADVASLLTAGETLRRRRDALAVELESQARGVAEIERRRREELPSLRQTLVECATHRERALRFRDSITLARDVIARLSGEVYHQWAARLDTDVSRLLALLSPEIESISFTPTLDFSVTPRGGRRLQAIEAERLLSGGQRDQVLLAIRLALARFLAGPDEGLPLVLDDPFARYDDERFARGMRALLGEAAGHQVILLTCHAQRLAWLAVHHPDAHAGWSRLSLAG